MVTDRRRRATFSDTCAAELQSRNPTHWVCFRGAELAPHAERERRVPFHHNWTFPGGAASLSSRRALGFPHRRRHRTTMGWGGGGGGGGGCNPPINVAAASTPPSRGVTCF